MNFRNQLFLALLTLSLLPAGNLLAQEDHSEEGHFDVFLGRPVSGTQTVYGGIDVDDADVELGVRIFEVELEENTLDGTFEAIEPGFNHPESDASLPAGVASLIDGDAIRARLLPTTLGNTTADLFYWNGLGPAAFTAATTGFEIQAGDPIGTAGSGGGFDDHPIFVVGSVGGTTPPLGIYVASFEAQVGDLDPTDPLFMVMGTEGLITAEFLGISATAFEMMTDEDLDEALEGVIELGVDFVQANIAVPEPASLLLVLSAVGMGLVGRGRQR